MTYQEQEEAIIVCHQYFSKMVEKKVGLPLPDLTFGMVDDIIVNINERLKYFD